MNLSISTQKKDFSEQIVKLTETVKKSESVKRELRTHINVLETALDYEKSSNFTQVKKLSQLKENLQKLKIYCNEMLSHRVKKIENMIINNS